MTALRGVKEEEYVFDDEKRLETFLSLNEAAKSNCKLSYSANKNSLKKQLSDVWGIEDNFSNTYPNDYADFQNAEKTWKDKYTTCSIASDSRCERLFSK